MRFQHLIVLRGVCLRTMYCFARLSLSPSIVGAWILGGNPSSHLGIKLSDIPLRSLSKGSCVDQKTRTRIPTQGIVLPVMQTPILSGSLLAAVLPLTRLKQSNLARAAQVGVAAGAGKTDFVTP